MTDDLERTTITEVPPPETPTIEPMDNGAPTGPVTAPPRPARGDSYRWLIAGGVVALVAAVTVLAVTLFTGRAANATVLGYVPADSIMYGEVRMDLPGDQRNNLGSFLSKFPGFADQSAIETKIDEILDRLVGGATDGSQTYAGDIKPWFSGEIAFSVGALPDPASLDSADATAMGDARALVMASVKDATAAQAWLDGIVSENGMSVTSESYDGASLAVVSEGAQSGAYAVVDGKVLMAGDIESVKAAVDTKGAGSFGTDARVKAALAATTGDHVGFVFLAVGPLMDWASQVSDTAGAPGLSSGLVADLVPEWAGFALRVEGDALRMEALAPRLADAEPMPNRATDVVQRVPATAIALSVSPDYGKGLLRTLEQYRAEPSMKEAMDSIDQALGLLGGADAAAAWMGDLGVAINRTGDGVEGGLVIVPTDRAAADRFFVSLKTLVSLGGSAMGIEVREEDHAGTTITIVDLGNLGDLAGLAGLPSDAVVGGNPIEDQHVELAYAVTDQVVVIGSGPGFVGRVLDTTAATSLGSTERYKDLAGRVGQGPGVVFADLTALRELVENGLATASPSDVAEYEQEIKPFLEPFDALVGSTDLSGEISRSTTIVTVK